MKLGYDQKLYILAFDHRGSFQKKFFGIEGEPDPEQTAIIADAKHLIFEGLLQAVGAGADPSVTGVLVDEQFGSTVPFEARERGLKLAMPAERSGQNDVRLPVRRGLRRAHRTLRPRLHEGARSLQPRRRQGRKPTSSCAKLKRLSDWLLEHEPQVPVRAARARRGVPARVGRRRRRPLRRRAAPRADAPGDRRDPGRRHRGRHLEDRGRRRALGLRDARRAGAYAAAATQSSAWFSAAAPTTPRSTTG